MVASVREILKQDLLGLNQIMEQNDVGQRNYRKCQKCNRPTFGHSKPGYGHKRCLELTVATNEQSKEIFGNFYKMDEGRFAKEIDTTRVQDLFHCEVCRVDFLYTEDFEEHQTQFHEVSFRFDM